MPGYRGLAILTPDANLWSLATDRKAGHVQHPHYLEEVDTKLGWGRMVVQITEALALQDFVHTFQMHSPGQAMHQLRSNQCQISQRISEKGS